MVSPGSFSFSHAPSQFCSAMCPRESEAQLLFSYRCGKQASCAGQSACARTALCPQGVAGLVPPPGKEQGKGTWATNAVSSLKASWSLVLDGSRRKDSNSFSLSAICLPVCEIVCVCVCARVRLSWKTTAPPVRIFHSDLLLPLVFKGFSDSETKPSR